METDRAAAADYDDRIRTWESKVPWYRRISARTGLQGKLIVTFTTLLILSLSLCAWHFIDDTRELSEELLGGKAAGVARAVAVAAEVALADGGNPATLDLIGRKVLADADVVGVAFFKSDGVPVSSNWRDAHADATHRNSLRNPRDNPTIVDKIVHGVHGPCLEVTVPVRQVTSYDTAVPARVVGFVTVCVSPGNYAARVSDSQGVMVLIGAFSALIVLPIVYLLVHRIFHPIRALVDATNRIAAGDLKAEVAVHRPDMIGTLARSFNEMVQRVRQQQNELEAANQDLEAKVQQRTAQVETANKRLRSEIAEKEDFLRAVSHDLNAPLRNISGMAAMLLMKHREQFDADVIHRLERIQKNVQVETDLIGELLELSRIKTRRQKPEPVNLNSLVEDLADVFEEDLRSRQIKLSIDTALPVIEGERARMRQVFQNLIDNAIKYMGDGPLREIHVGCEVRHEEAEFYVRDTGIGIEPEDLDRVFSVFRRGKSAAVQAVSGKGIGLASVKSIVETYEGTIGVQSEPGKGTTFRFTINGKFVPDSQKLMNDGGVSRGKAA